MQENDKTQGMNDKPEPPPIPAPQPFHEILKLLQRNPRDRALRVNRDILEHAIMQHLQLGRMVNELNEKLNPKPTENNDEANRQVLDNLCAGEQRDRGDTETPNESGADGSSDTMGETETPNP